MKQRLARISEALRSGVLRSIGVLVGGTAAAHLITALALPVSTRLFTPADFSAAAVFASLSAILTVAACLRFDMAIPLPEDEAEAANLLGLAIGFSVVTAGLTALVLALLPASAIALLGQPALTPWLWLLPIAVLIGGVYLAIQMWYVRRKGFAAIARSRIAQSACAAGGQIGLGFAGFTPLGLIVGQVLNYGAGSIGLLAGTMRRDGALLRGISRSGMVAAFRGHQRFPRYSIWEALANAASINVPILLIAALASGPEAGYLTLAMFLMQAPMALLGNSIGQVYLSGAPDAARDGRLATYTAASLGGLIRAVTPPLIFIGIVSPTVFPIIFGAGWERSGVLVAWMVPWFLLQFLASPVSSALHVMGQQRVAMLLQLFGFVVRVGAVVAASVFTNGWISEVYAISGAILYGAYLWVVMRIVQLPTAALVGPFKKTLPIAVIATGAGAALSILAPAAVQQWL